MSITQVMQSAVSALNTQARAIDITSSNIANVNTEGYARRQVQFDPLVIDGKTAGVELGQALQVIDRFLQTELIGVSAATGFYQAQADLHSRLQDFLGRPDLDMNLSARLNEVFAAFSQLAVEPDELARRFQTLEGLMTLATEINRLSERLHYLRAEAETRISSNITRINSALARIHELNPQIANLNHIDGDASALVDQRQRALNELSELIDLHVIEKSDGQIDIFTRSGLTLLDRNLRMLEYNAAGIVDAATPFDAIRVFRLDLGGNKIGTGDPLYPKLRSGALKGLIDMRDIELPDLAARIGNISSMLIDQINRAHNASSAVPAPASLVGIDTGLAADDAHGFTGIVDFVQLAADGTLQAQATIDFANPGLVTLADVVAAVNAALPGAGLALVGGVLTFSATAPGSGVAVVDDATTASDRGGRGFAHFFGLNDLMRAAAPSHFDTGFTTADAHGFGAVGTVDFRIDGPGGQTISAYTLDFASGFVSFGDVLADLNTAFGGFATFALDANGRLTTTLAPAYESFHLSVGADTTTRGTSTQTFSELFGLGRRFTMETARSVAVVDRIADDPGLLATAGVDLAAPAGQPVLVVGDNAGAMALKAIESTIQNFGAAGGLPAMMAELPRYAALILGGIGQEAARIASLAEDRNILLEEIEARRQSFSGVNLDEELSNMILYQNAYNAAARMIKTANEMFDVLLSIAN